jgi:NADPH:quinone reductase-like Zn-dependent oxidoreductase
MSTAITYSRYGAPDVLTVTSADIPQPGPGQVLIRVRAVAVNPIDVKIRSEALPELAALMAGGRLAVPIWRAYPLARAAQAHADLEARRNHGKIVLLP